MCGGVHVVKISACDVFWGLRGCVVHAAKISASNMLRPAQSKGRMGSVFLFHHLCFCIERWGGLKCVQNFDHVTVCKRVSLTMMTGNRLVGTTAVWLVCDMSWIIYERVLTSMLALQVHVYFITGLQQVCYLQGFWMLCVEDALLKSLYSCFSFQGLLHTKQYSSEIS